MNKIEKMLVNKLGIKPKDIEYGDGITYKFNSKTYIVANEEEAFKLIVDQLTEDIRNMGLDSFTPTFREEIINKFLDKNYIKKQVEDILHSQIQELDNEELDEELESQVEDFDKYKNLSRYNKEMFVVQNKIENIENNNGMLAVYREHFDDNYISEEIKYNPDIVDIESLTEEAIRLDGKGHFLAYDGEEIELEDGYNAYRVE